MSQTKKISIILIIVLFCLALLKIFLIGAGTITKLEPTQNSIFPTLYGVSLDGKEITLPRDFKTPLNLVVLAFDDDQQKSLDTWSDGFHKNNLSEKNLDFYALPVLYEMEYIQRFFYNNWLKLKSGDAAYKKKTITIYVDRSKFFKMMDIDDETVYAFLINKQGEILWVRKGKFSENYLSEIQSFIKSY